MTWRPSLAQRYRSASGRWRSARCSRRGMSMSCSSSSRQTGRPLRRHVASASCAASAGHPHSQQKAAADAHPRAARVAPAAPDASNPRGNARQRCSAERSAQRHAARRMVMRTRCLALLFVIRLRRHARVRRDLEDLEELGLARHLASKRGPESEPHSSSASSCDPHDFEHHHVLGVVKTSTRVSHLAKRFGGDARRPLLR